MKNWREMITVYSLREGGHDPISYLNTAQNSNLRDCPRPLQRPVTGGRDHDMPIATTLLVCGDVPGLHLAEVAVVKAIAGKDGIFVFHRQWRVPSAEPASVIQSLAKEIDEGFELAGEVRICDTRDMARSCKVGTEQYPEMHVYPMTCLCKPSITRHHNGESTEP